MNYENYDPYFPDQPVVDLYLPVWANLPAFRTKAAFVWAAADNGGSTTDELTYAQLNSSAHSIAAKLVHQLKRRESVVIVCSPGLDLIKVIFGCQRAGLMSVPISPPHPSLTKQDCHHLIRALSQTNPKAAIAQRSYIEAVRRYLSSSTVSDERLSRLLQGLRWISTDDLTNDGDGDEDQNASSDHFSYHGCKAEEIYLVQYSSGATGIPKPVLVSAGAAAHNVRAARRAYHLHPNTMIVSWLPQYHDCGLMFLLLTVVSGATSVLTSPAAFVNRPRIWLELISKNKATCTPVPSFALPLVLKRGGVEKGSLPINLWSLKNLIIINEPIYRDSVEEFVAAFRPFGLNPACISPSYGLAENCTFVSTAWRSSSSNGEYFSSFPNIPSYNKLLPSARLASDSQGTEEEEEADIEILVVNEETEEAVEDGIEGEIWVSSPSNASGYLAHPSLTRHVFRRRPSNSSRCFVRTGDVGVVKGEERFLYITGRCSDVIELRNGGRKVHPHYIETAAYRSCQKFLRGGCLAAFKISRRAVLVAEMQQQQQRRGEEEEEEEEEEDKRVLKILCGEIREGVMREEKVGIDRVVLVKAGSVPKTTSGKIQRWATKDKLIRVHMGIVLMDMLFEEEEEEEETNNNKQQLSGGGRKTTISEKENNVISPCSSSPTQVGSRSFL